MLNNDYLMNVLFITYDFPFPITSGGKNRAFNLIKSTSKKANIYLLSFVRENFNHKYFKEIEEIGVKKIFTYKRRSVKSFSNITTILLRKKSIFKSLYFEQSVARKLNEIVKEHKIDIIHFESSYTGFYINFDTFPSSIKKVLGTENIEFMLYKDLATQKKFPMNFLINSQAELLKSEEISMMKNSDIVTVITKDESEIVNKLTGIKPSIVANGIDTEKLSYSFTSNLKNNILFVGNFSYFPNIEAVNFFYESVIKKMDSNINFTIIGKDVLKRFKFNDNRIIVKDYVENIDEEYKKADVFVFPVKIGGGTNFKILESMALGTPIVAFPQRLSGFNAKDGEHFLKAEGGYEFISQIKKLYDDQKLREKLSLNARKLVEKDFAWKTIGNDLLEVWNKVYERA